MVVPRSLTFLTAFHGGWDFGCCRIGLAASAMDFESGLPPGMQGQSLLHRKAKIPFPAGCVAHSPTPCRPGSEAGVPGAVAPGEIK